MAGGNKVIITKNKTRIVNANRMGPPGPQGPALEALDDIGDVSLEGLNNRDVLQYNASTEQWENMPQEDIVDGGNF